METLAQRLARLHGELAEYERVAADRRAEAARLERHAADRRAEIANLTASAAATHHKVSFPNHPLNQPVKPTAYERLVGVLKTREPSHEWFETLTFDFGSSFAPPAAPPSEAPCRVRYFGELEPTGYVTTMVVNQPFTKDAEPPKEYALKLRKLASIDTSTKFFKTASMIAKMITPLTMGERILQLVNEAPGRTFTVAEIAHALGEGEDRIPSLRATAAKLTEAGKLARVGVGKYTAEFGKQEDPDAQWR
ncbi:MAG: hypothetical protein K8M05_23720 [Deltaproteobacteria bacterium]|nr:hypothetical protein [Kofleriaceae bacterium]